MSLKHFLSHMQLWSVYAVFPLPLSTKAGSLTRYTVGKTRQGSERSAAHHATGEASTTLQYNPDPDSLLRKDWPRENFLLSDQKQKAKDQEIGHQMSYPAQRKSPVRAPRSPQSESPLSPDRFQRSHWLSRDKFLRSLGTGDCDVTAGPPSVP